jgi:hypothetical protein
MSAEPEQSLGSFSSQTGFVTYQPQWPVSFETLYGYVTKYGASENTCGCDHSQVEIGYMYSSLVVPQTLLRKVINWGDVKNWIAHFPTIMEISQIEKSPVGPETLQGFII